jgi:hypothetical protein
MATTRTEDGHKKNTKTSVTVKTKGTKKHKTTEVQFHFENQGTGNTPNPP